MMIIKESALKKGLPKETETICPECGKVVKGTIFEENGKVMISKTCDEHGEFKDVYWSDVDLYLKAEQWAFDGVGITNPNNPKEGGYPENPGYYEKHLSLTSLANLDLTNRCNLKCPVCFANANHAGYVFEPSYEEIVEMMKTLRAEEPVETKAIQFAGGEPTIYPDFFKVLEAARDLGFAQIQVATNGIKLAEDPEFAQKMLDSGAHTIYLQFDGLREENYIAARGKPLLEVKKKAVENCRNTKPNKMSIVLVPTLINGINDDQLGEIMEFALENKDVVRGVNFQPVAFTGRIDQDERVKGRFTLTDMVDRMEKQTGYTTKDDWYPVPFVAPISELVSVLWGQPQIAFTSHPHCGLATYLFVSEDNKVTPITRFIDVEGLMKDILELSRKSEGKKIMLPVKVKALGLMKKHFLKEKAPEGLDFMKFLKVMETLMTSEDKKGMADFSWNMMFVGGMHFQDSYNYDIERLKRCVIHYVTPDQRIIPFCAYNSGPTLRTEVEKKYSIPIEEWRKKHGTQYT